MYKDLHCQLYQHLAIQVYSHCANIENGGYPAFIYMLSLCKHVLYNSLQTVLKQNTFIN